MLCQNKLKLIIMVNIISQTLKWIHKKQKRIFSGPGLPPKILVSTDEDLLTVSWSPTDEYTSIDIVVSGERRGAISRKIDVSLHRYLHSICRKRPILLHILIIKYNKLYSVLKC